MLDTLCRDGRYGARMLLSHPAVTLAAVLSLAIGIGANTAVFSVVNELLLRPLPVSNVERLLVIYTSHSGGDPYDSTSYPDYQELRRASDVFSDLVSRHLTLLNLSLDHRSELVIGEVVSGNYFDALGVRAALGRTFLPEEDRTPGTHPVTVLGHRLWRRRFNSDPTIVGKAIRLNGHSFTVVGVAPSSFTGTIPLCSPDLWTPVSMETVIGLGGPNPKRLENRERRFLSVMGRLKPGATLAQAKAQLDAIMVRLAAEYPETNRGLGVTVVPAEQLRAHPMLDKAAYPTAAVLMAMVSLVLLVACANVANLLLVRASARRQEIAVRLSVGAGRASLIRQLLTESAMLALAGGTLGLLLAYWCIQLLRTMQLPFPVSLPIEVGIDLRVLSFTLLASMVTAVVFGLLPAVRASRIDVVTALKGELPPGWFPGRRLCLRNLLVVGQVAVSLGLLIAAGLFLRSLRDAHAAKPGFETKGIAILTIDLNMLTYSEEEALRFYQRAIEHLRSLPGTMSAALTNRVPLGWATSTEDFIIESYEPTTGEEHVTIDTATVGPGYFTTMGIPLLEGRDVSEADTKDAARVAVVNETMALRFWPGESAVGKRVRQVGSTETWIEVIGVCRDYRVRALGESQRPYLHASFKQDFTPFQSILVRTHGAPSQMLEIMRRELRMLSPDLVFFDTRTMQENLAIRLFPIRVGRSLLAVFAVVALGMASVGLYGVVSYSVGQRTREFGLRMALGARTIDVLKLVVNEAMALIGTGIALGLVGAWTMTWVLSRVLYGISATDPLTFGASSLAVVSVALGASVIPVRRAAWMQPTAALRHE